MREPGGATLQLPRRSFCGGHRPPPAPSRPSCTIGPARSRHVRVGIAFGLSRSGGISAGSLHAQRCVALRHHDLVAVRRGRSNEWGWQIATARARTSPGFNVNRTGRGLHGNRSRCATCRGQHRRRCGGYQKIQLPHITKIATSNARARLVSTFPHDASRHDPFSTHARSLTVRTRAPQA